MNRRNHSLYTGLVYLALFVLWTVLVQTVDVRPAGETGQAVGFAALNLWFHRLTGVHMGLYTITDWLGLVPLGVCLAFGFLGLMQLLRRKRLLQVDPDLLLLGLYYVLVILGYCIFETYPINYRPIFIDGRLEASYPSSTTLLVLSVMPTLAFQLRRRLRQEKICKIVRILTALFSLAMVMGRLVSGVHWLTDIIGSVLLSRGLFMIYRGSVRFCSGQGPEKEVPGWSLAKNCSNCEKTEG